MPRARNGNVEIEWQAFGPEGAEAVLLINGLGSQMTRWPEAFCEKLVAKGYRAIRFDNRDVGLSTWFASGDRYRLEDMAADAVAVLDAAGVSRAHVAGVSMGGMIAQLVAADHADRTLSLTSIMSSTGDPAGQQASPEASAVLLTPAPDPKVDRDAYIAHGLKNASVIGSPAYPWDPDLLRERVIAEMERAYNPTGVARQMGAVRDTGDRRAKLATIRCPAVVLHGEVDPLIPVQCGRDTAANIAGAELIVVPGMGHDLPPSLYDIFVDAITAAAARAKAPAE